jgi:hypothetical protein
MQTLAATSHAGRTEFGIFSRKDAKAAEKNKSNSELGVFSALAGEMSESETVSNSQKIGVSRGNF